MKNSVNGYGSAIKSQYTSIGTSGPTIPSSSSMISIKRNMDPASSNISHKCPVPSFFENRGRHMIK